MRSPWTRSQRARARRIGVYVATSGVLGAVLWFTDWRRIQTKFADPTIFADQFPEVVTIAARNTMIFTVLGFSGGLVLGLVIALLRLSPVRGYRWLAATYIELFRGLPALVTIILVGFVLPIALGIRIPGTYGRGAVALSIVAAAYMAETIRAGIEAVPPGQTEAARSLGMSSSQAMVFIVLPQAFRIMIPPLTNEMVLLLKDTSLLFVLGTSDATIELAKYGRDGVSDTFNGTPLTVIALVYLAITVPLTRAVALLERRASAAR